jgi:glycosyltransferase involved in cell wall biosynthesis
MSELLRVPPDKVRVVPLGVNLEGFAPRTPRAAGAPFTVGFFARVAPEKGLHVLAEAYCGLRERGELEGARLEAAGYLAPEHADYLRGVERLMGARGLAREFNYRGSPDRDGKIEFLRSLDLFSLPATYDEPKGLSLIEALACGVPSVVPRRGALTEIVGRTGGGVLVEPDDPAALADAILALAKDPARAEAMGRAGAAGAREHHSVGRMAERALEVYEEIARGAVGGDAVAKSPEAARVGA